MAGATAKVGHSSRILQVKAACGNCTGYRLHIAEFPNHSLPFRGVVCYELLQPRVGHDRD
jgi:hypothetical protein